MHPQSPNTQTLLPACLLSTACDYYGLNCFDALDLKRCNKAPLGRKSGSNVAKSNFELRIESLWHLSDHQRGIHNLRGTLPTTSSQAELLQGLRNTLK
jgi:hypothetical protein